MCKVVEIEERNSILYILYSHVCECETKENSVVIQIFVAIGSLRIFDMIRLLDIARSPNTPEQIIRG